MSVHPDCPPYTEADGQYGKYEYTIFLNSAGIQNKKHRAGAASIAKWILPTICDENDVAECQRRY